VFIQSSCAEALDSPRRPPSASLPTRTRQRCNQQRRKERRRAVPGPMPSHIMSTKSRCREMNEGSHTSELATPARTAACFGPPIWSVWARRRIRVNKRAQKCHNDREREEEREERERKVQERGVYCTCSTTSLAATAIAPAAPSLTINAASLHRMDSALSTSP
jgi:hypothetical protein